MRHTRSVRLAVGLGVFSLLACGGSEAQSSMGEGAPATATASSAAPIDVPPGEANAAGTRSGDRLEVKIADGPFAGTHQASGDFNCFAQQGIWGATHTIDLERPRGLAEFLMMLTGVPATGGRSKDVNLTLTFGSPTAGDLDAGLAGIGAVAGGGSGDATVERRGRGAVIRIEGTNASGGDLSAVIECRAVDVVS